MKSGQAKYDWCKLISEYESFDGTQKEFCKQAGINYKTFTINKSKLKKLDEPIDVVPLVVKDDYDINFICDNHQYSIKSSDLSFFLNALLNGESI